MRTESNNQLEGYTYFVTGGSKGIGYATAEALLLKGANVAIASRGEAASKIAVDNLNQLQATGSVLGVTADVSNKTEITHAINLTVDTFGSLDGLINNAGITSFKKFEDINDQDLDSLLGINFYGLIYASQAAIPHLRKSDNPRIINVSSASARHTDEMAHLGLYAATKAAVERISIEMQEELRADNIAVTIFSPGGVTTEQAVTANPEDLTKAIAEWQNRSNHFSGYLEATTVGESIAQCLCFPKGSALDFIELRPNKIFDKKTFVEVNKKN